ncbi:MAG: YihA family ribosome biogenesis GTP-binding protein [Deltaproteobacteria bacterium CG2_30_63_29]|nr:MAG: YihA family ribosome biogenesis GTP-binding protein [Deltaproteobacteria bacterium CG2_30_63_29]PIW02398.1 MAG: YihA family ribosome biogenesis GTP-binding protein [Deltaproteobacteria bacterium CG17_big_fil_post_rev_8_21_14_2_50_63_7]PJB45919.1 MAG: YihA family ribosome biogenesis GTP-binding protein [Deltaproteobacteria bacterium CG_4_9_14_3_um_filter_63_12]
MKLTKVEFLLSAAKPVHYPAPDRPEVAFAGRSNVGKSSLLNALLNRRNIARVSRTPGRTQLINFFDINGTLYLVDLPGYGYAKVPVAVQRQWGPMMERYVRSRETLAAMVVLLDVRRDPNADDLQLLNALNAMEIAAIVVLTKCDKLSGSQSNTRRKEIANVLGCRAADLIAFSSQTRQGRGELWRAIADCLPSDPAPSEELPIVEEAVVEEPPSELDDHE